MPPRVQAPRRANVHRKLRPGLRAALLLLVLVPALALVPSTWPWSPLPGNGPPPGDPEAAAAEVIPIRDRERCLAGFEETHSPLLSVADINRTLVVDRHNYRQTSLDPENVILLRTLGWTPGTDGTFTDVEDVTLTESIVCTAVQDVHLDEDDVLAAVALAGNLGERPKVGDIARIVMTLTLNTTTTQVVDLDAGTVEAALSLRGPGEFTLADILALASTETEVSTAKHYRQEVTLNPDDVVNAIAGSRPAGPG